MTTIACCLLEQNCLNIAECNELKHNLPSLCVFERKILNEVVQNHLRVYSVSRMHMSS